MVYGYLISVHFSAAMATLVSWAGGLLAMLNESRPELKLYALSNLNKLVDGFWPEISTSVPIMYSLSLSLSLWASSFFQWL
jgi:26S proteasome regulatory subunit N2